MHSGWAKAFCERGRTLSNVRQLVRRSGVLFGACSITLKVTNELIQKPHSIRVISSLTLVLAAFAATAAQAGAQGTGGAAFQPRQLVIKYKDGADRAAQVAARRGASVKYSSAIAARSSVVELKPGQTLAAAAAELRATGDVEYAVPNYKARISEWIPNDPGRGEPGDWRSLQWNFVGAWGVNALNAWNKLYDTEGAGGRGVIVAVIDTGVAYERYGRFYRSPDLAGVKIFRPYDFVSNDRHANDYNGHGTHVASTIAERVDNGVGVTGLAYNATLMPLRALDQSGAGDSSTIARAIRYAARNRAKVINLSMEFDGGLRARHIPEIVSAIKFATSRGALVVGAAGNQGSDQVAYPSRASHALSVGATTRRGCLAVYSNAGSGLDLVAPGGGKDSRDADLTPGSTDLKNCDPTASGPPIYQVTLSQSSFRFFTISSDYEGTSMAAPHVTATAALVIASGVLGPNPHPDAIKRRLRSTARDLGAPGRDLHYGVGLIDAGAAVGATSATGVVPPPAG